MAINNENYTSDATEQLQIAARICKHYYALSKELMEGVDNAPANSIMVKRELPGWEPIGVSDVVHSYVNHLHQEVVEITASTLVVDEGNTNKAFLLTQRETTVELSAMPLFSSITLLSNGLFLLGDNSNPHVFMYTTANSQVVTITCTRAGADGVRIYAIR